MESENVLPRTDLDEMATATITTSITVTTVTTTATATLGAIATSYLPKITTSRCKLEWVVRFRLSFSLDSSG